VIPYEGKNGGLKMKLRLSPSHSADYHGPPHCKQLKLTPPQEVEAQRTPAAPKLVSTHEAPENAPSNGSRLGDSSQTERIPAPGTPNTFSAPLLTVTSEYTSAPARTATPAVAVASEITSAPAATETSGYASAPGVAETSGYAPAPAATEKSGYVSAPGLDTAKDEKRGRRLKARPKLDQRSVDNGGSARFVCCKCGKEEKTRTYLYVHYSCAHFRKQIYKKCGNVNRCPEISCGGREFPSETATVTHCGATHDFAEFFLKPKHRLPKAMRIRKSWEPRSSGSSDFRSKTAEKEYLLTSYKHSFPIRKERWEMLSAPESNALSNVNVGENATTIKEESEMGLVITESWSLQDEGSLEDDVQDQAGCLSDES